MADTPRRSVRFHIWRASLLILLPYLILGWASSRLEVDPMAAGVRLAGTEVDAAGGARATRSRDGAAGGAPGARSEVEEAVLPGLPFTARGALSVHSGRSHDAEGTFEEVAAPARATGLDFVILGDHPTAWIDEPGVFDPRRVDDVHISRGAELVVSEAGRTLTVGLEGVPRMWTGTLPELRAAVESEGGWVSIVHPRSPRYRESWKIPSVVGAHTFEAFDISEMARLRLASIWGPYHLISFLTGMVADRSDEAVLRLWRERSRTPAMLAYDSLRATTRMSLTGGLNHHSKMRTPIGLFPPFGPMYRTVVNHLHLESPLSEDPWQAQREIAAALRDGRLYISLGWPEDAGGFVFAAEGRGEPEGTEGARDADATDAPRPSPPGLHPPGSVLALSHEARLVAHLPAGGGASLLVELRRDGEIIDRREAGPGSTVRWNPERPGVYRVEVHRAGIDLGPLRLGRFPWLFSNPIEFTAP